MFWFVLSVVINVIVTLVIVVFAMKINSDFITKFLSETEDRFDRKLNLRESMVKQHQ
jgi:cell division protein FtsW (lipid II flippase)